jgi:hypothetical protein
MNGINTGIFHPTLQGHVSEASLIAPIIAALDWSRAPPIRALSRSCSREVDGTSRLATALGGQLLPVDEPTRQLLAALMIGLRQTVVWAFLARGQGRQLEQATSPPGYWQIDELPAG